MDKLLPSDKVLVILATSNTSANFDYFIPKCDLNINIRNPDTAGRKAILQYYLRQTKYSRHINIETVALRRVFNSFVID